MVILPEAGPRARFLFDFNAAACLAAPEQSLNARTGQVATFTRATSIQNAPDSRGALQRFASNLPAFHWSVDPVTGLSTPGVLFEKGATNLLLRSSDFTVPGAWSPFNVTITGDAANAPDGTLTADKLQCTATGGAQVNTPAVASTAAAMTFSVHVKRGNVDTGANTFGVYNTTTAAWLVQASLNYATGVLTVTTGAGTVERLADGWFRVMLNASGITVGNNVVGYVCWASNPGTGGDFAYAWGGQLEAGAVATSYIPTTTATAARAATLSQYTFNVPPSAMTVYSKLIDVGYSGGGNSTAWVIGNNGATPPYFGLQLGTAFFHSGAVQSVSAFALTHARGAMVETCVTLDATGVVIQRRSVNGGADVVGPTGVATTFPAAFGAAVLTLGGGTTWASAGAAMHALRVAAGVRSLDYMRTG